jgi:hypothetical protein
MHINLAQGSIRRVVFLQLRVCNLMRGVTVAEDGVWRLGSVGEDLTNNQLQSV